MPLVYACIMPHAPILVPAIGAGIEEETPHVVSALREVAGRMRQARPETVVIVSPHGPFRYATIGILASAEVSGSFAEWRHPDLAFRYEVDAEIADAVYALAVGSEAPVERLTHWGRGLDWGCLVPLFWLREAIMGARLLPIAISHAAPRSHYDLGMCIADVARDSERRVAVVCSADLSHALSRDAPAGYDPAGRLFDDDYRKAIDAWDERWILSAPPDLRSHAAEDAIPQTAVLMGALRDCMIRPRVLAYDAPFGVGYLVASIGVVRPAPARDGAARAGRDH